ncbi:ABC transporter permease [Aquimarina aggregata]|uniref:ABC transporter permease n=1 Tax=Aquimarina aggregata TaxID=1642818 RepID=A0A162WEY2_9FLAO|nr:ABC transporter permease [Aquimarina aggregata]KZS38050.1 ABC transporter permease [Aquimarina aggregata]
MFKNHIIIAWRNLLKNKAFTLLNIVGLSVAIGVAILLSMAAFFELSYDNFHKKGDTVYQLYSDWQIPGGNDINVPQPMPLATALKDEVPGISKISRYLDGHTLLLHNKKELTVDMTWVDPDFFSIFSFPLETGNQDTLLQEANTVVMTNKMATTIFGNSDVIGKTIDLLIKGKKTPFVITAILKDVPDNSTIQIGVLGNFKDSPRYHEVKNRWDHSNHEVYMELQEGVSVSQFEKSTRSLVNLHFKEEIENTKRDGASPDENGQFVQLKLNSFKDAHFSNYKKNEVVVSRALPYVILGIAILLLFIACVNFVNMSIAKSTNRLQEIGMRKTLGAGKKHVFLQFWSESVLVFLVTLLLGGFLSFLLLDEFKSLFNTGATFNNTLSLGTIFVFGVIFLLLTGITGGYPALLLSKLGTLQALKGKVQINGRDRVRDILMIIQFAIVILLISGTFVLRGQLQYMRTKDLGFNKEQVISVPLNGKRNGYKLVNLLREEFKDQPDIINITASRGNLGRGRDGSQYTSQIGFDYKNRQARSHMFIVDYDYLKTLDIKLLSGRSFDRSFGSDSLSVVINEAMVEELQETDPIGKKLRMNSIDYTVVGVVKDFNFKKLDQTIAPMTLFMSSQKDVRYAYFKIAPTNISQTYDHIRSIWKKLEPNATFLGSFLNENIDRTFKKERIMITIITSGAAIAVLLSCIGLLAISLLVVNMRTKEIGVRKVIGASVFSLIVLLAKDFVKLVIISFIIIIPVAWWYSNQWLQEYSYRMDLSIWFFIAAGLSAIGIALGTIGFGTIKAALQNPVKSLRSE